MRLTTSPLDIWTGINSARSRIDLEIPFFLRSPFDQAFFSSVEAGEEKPDTCYKHVSYFVMLYDLLSHFDPLVYFCFCSVFLLDCFSVTLFSPPRSSDDFPFPSPLLWHVTRRICQIGKMDRWRKSQTSKRVTMLLVRNGEQTIRPAVDEGVHLYV